MFCTRKPEELSSRTVYEKITSNLMLLYRCKEFLNINSGESGFYHMYLLNLQRLLCNIVLTSAITLCETYISATNNFRQNRDSVDYKRALFTHKGKLHHADVDYHDSCYIHRRENSDPAVLTSSFLDRCATAVWHAHNIHSYISTCTQAIGEPNVLPLKDLIERIVESTGVLYTPLVLPPDLVEHTRPAANCRQCSRTSVIRGTMTISGQDPMCACTISLYTGTNVDGGKHAPLISARRVLYDTTQRSLCLHAPLCGCSIHKGTFSSTLKQLVTALTGHVNKRPASQIQKVDSHLLPH